MNWENRVEHAGASDIGIRRSNNQDSFAILLAPSEDMWRKRGHLFLVADGMGAHAVGELASKLAVDMITHNYHKLVGLPAAEALRKAFADANTSIHNKGQANRDFQGMGTTSTALVLFAEGALVAHVGDSRAYRIRQERIDQLSFDHSLAWELMRRRRLTPDQVRLMVPSNVITRSLGPEAQVEIDLEGPLPVEASDIYVLCSDGLSGQATDQEIGVLASWLPADEACNSLIDLANLRGGPDNITTLVIRVPGASDDGQPRASAKREASRPSGRRWSWRLLRPLIGAGSALAAIGLGVVWKLGGSSDTNVLAAGLLTALAGLIFMGGTEFLLGSRRKPLAQEDPAHEPKSGYRSVACHLDGSILSRIAGEERTYYQEAVEQSWDVDWVNYYQKRAQAEESLAAERWPEALHGYSKLLSLLASGLRRTRTSGSAPGSSAR